MSTIPPNARYWREPIEGPAYPKSQPNDDDEDDDDDDQEHRLHGVTPRAVSSRRESPAAPIALDPARCLSLADSRLC